MTCPRPGGTSAQPNCRAAANIPDIKSYRRAPHILEHIALELQTARWKRRALRPGGPSGDEGVWWVIVAYDQEEVTSESAPLGGSTRDAATVFLGGGDPVKLVALESPRVGIVGTKYHLDLLTRDLATSA